MWSRVAGSAVIVAAACALLAPSAGAEPIGSQFPITASSGERDAVSSSVAQRVRAGAGGYTVVWQDGRIYGRRYDANGKPMTPAFAISSADGSQPDIAYNSRNDEFLVTWASGEQSTINARRLAASGALRGEESTVSIPVDEANFPLSHRSPAVAYNPDRNEYLLTWDSVPYGEYPDLKVLGRRLAADGRALSGQFQVGLTSESTAQSDVAYDARTKSYTVVASFYCSGCGSYSTLSGRRIGPTGALLGSAFRINDYPPAEPGPDFASHARDASVAFNARSGELLVVWADGTAYSGDYLQRGREISIRGQRYAGGTRVGGNVVLSTKRNLTGAMQNAKPAVAANPATGQYVLAWSDGYEIYAERLDATARVASGRDIRLSRMGPDGDVRFTARAPAVAGGMNGGFLISWDSDNTLDDVFDVYGHRFGA